MDRGLPFGGGVLDLRKLGDVVAGILERDRLAPAGKRDRIIEGGDQPWLPSGGQLGADGVTFT